ncbi:hypothetical protein FRB90_008308 [Tulasnella sp. 427]|nr:hypothetical protein FRB90_008308 [Tulasnella sp. 427]
MAELLRLILKTTLDHFSIPWGVQEYYVSIYKLSRVCKRWSELLDATPELWIHLSPYMPEYLIKMAILKSRDLPVTISGEVDDDDPLDLLLGQMHRCKRIGLTSAFTHTSLSRIMACSAPLLERLVLNNRFLGDEQPRIFFNDFAPNLQYVSIWDARFQWTSPALSELLELDLGAISGDVLDTTAILKLLSRSPRLTALRLQQMSVPLSPPPRPHVALGQLQSLELGRLSPGALEQLIKYISIPHSTECVFRVLLEPETVIDEQLEPLGQRLVQMAGNDPHSHMLQEKEAGNDPPDIKLLFCGDNSRQGSFELKIDIIPRRRASVFEYFARKLAQGFSDPSHAPIITIIGYDYLSHPDSQSCFLQRLRDILPGIKNIRIEESSYASVARAMDILYPIKHPFQLFSNLSMVTVRYSKHDKWVEEWSRHGRKGERRVPLRLQTLTLEGGQIGAEWLQRLEGLAQHVVLSDVRVMA